MISQVFFERSSEKTFWNNVLLVLINPRVSLSRYQASASQKGWWRLCENKYEHAVHITPFREEEKRRHNWTSQFLLRLSKLNVVFLFFIVS